MTRNMVKFARNLLATTAILFSAQSAYSAPDVFSGSPEYFSFLNKISKLFSEETKDEKAGTENPLEGKEGEESLSSGKENLGESTSSHGDAVLRGLSGGGGEATMSSKTKSTKSSNADLVARGSKSEGDLQPPSSQAAMDSSQGQVSSAKPFVANREGEPVPQRRTPQRPVQKRELESSSAHPQSTGLGHGGGGETYSGSSSSPSIGGGGGGGGSASSDTVELTPEQFEEYQKLKSNLGNTVSPVLSAPTLQSSKPPVVKAPEPIVPQVPAPAPIVEAEESVLQQAPAPAPIIEAEESVLQQAPAPVAEIEVKE
ncbi:MAG: hypothetical protein K2W92_03370, partial [Alphaproteobacteria bacterium]|nr:hypothetical protein [Alphaproteobacteria bacterium]